MIGHGPLRSYVMGYERCQSQVDASKEEISKMSDIVTEAIESGALALVLLEQFYIEMFTVFMFQEQKQVQKK